MSSTESLTDIDYPESDGQPMGETEIHIEWMIRLRDILKLRYRERRVYVGSNLLVYPEEGVPRNFVVPDVFVVKDCEPGRRRIFQTWVENRVPNVVFEITSRSTRRQDSIFKLRQYAEMGVAEYFLFDPTSDYLSPALQGYRLVDDEYEPIEANSAGRLECRELGLDLALSEERLRLFDSIERHELLTEAETEAHARAEAEAEVERLRKLLDERDNSA
ncbi:Uma2 family endonuclease [Thalassoroseus pseudoceratinae]|uniref:Uma2 family endonuclease n=1 Tax=Thalassoroseus pseudoceratinae TaxID=2713176 RepID=UPI00141F0C54|nr:Uma2 family endonuclease [Thalassoroseus pseudoceratinae]